tara:strand:+ start:4156 stop:4983 length:828 start_codon:yes stop_codon:yes gene_type:complete
MTKPTKNRRNKPLIEVTNLSFSYGDKKILSDINFSVEPNTFVAVLGINGTGKSTLIKCLNKINKLTEGEVKINSMSIDDMTINELAKMVAYVPQNVSTSFPIDVYDVILLGRRPYLNWSIGDYDRDIVAKVIQNLRLQDFAFRKFHTLSGGEQQKVVIAKAIVQEPQIYLFDEPTSSLDLFSQYDILGEIKSLVEDKSNPCSAIVAMHDINLASKFADKVLIIHKSEVYCYDAPCIALNIETVSEVYGVDAELLRETKSGSPIINVLRSRKEELQ